jgi:hypothetical protein|tara:strand:+ start:277 stop:468 length:192 start_codon:yes stop_codon:yes gene_type:complete
MESKAFKSLDELKVLKGIITAMEKNDKDERNPEYVIRNIQLIDKILFIFQDYKNELIEKLPRD